MIDDNDDLLPESPTSFAAEMSAKEAHRLATRPNIDDLVDAVVKDELGRQILLVKPGEKLIVERFATILAGRPWLDTKTYTVQSIDEATGRVRLWDDELQRQALTDYISGTKAGYRFKLPIKGRPMVTNKRKRGRPKKIVVAPAVAPAATVQQPVGPDGEPVKRGRGRPKGTKNRDAATIAAEKKAKAELKAAKKRAKVEKKAKLEAVKKAKVKAAKVAETKKKQATKKSAAKKPVKKEAKKKAVKR